MSARFSSFLSRLTQAQAPTGAEAVARNLEHLLNTRKGCGSVIAGLGLGDYEAAPNTHHAVLALRAEIEQMVRVYEPRVVDPVVTLLGRLGYRTVRFELRGVVRGEAQVIVLDIDTSTRAVVVTVEAAR
jgi:type VI secretion system lysozyme-like protein